MSPSRQEHVAEEGHPTALGPVVVTDTELAVLEAAHRRLLGEPEAVSPPDEGAAKGGGEREARRSLVARGLLGERGELPEDDDVGVLVATLLDLRLAAERVLVAERIMAAGDPGADSVPRSGDDPSPEDLGVRRDIRLVHLLGSGACVEDLLPDGSHHLYLLLDRDDVVPWVTAVTVPPQAAAGAGPVLTVQSDRPEEIARMLGHPSVLAELSVLASGEEALEAVRDTNASPAHQLLALGRSGCWLTDVDPGRSLPDSVEFRPVDPGWVGQWVRSVLEVTPAVPEAGRRDGGGAQGTMSG